MAGILNPMVKKILATVAIGALALIGCLCIGPMFPLEPHATDLSHLQAAQDLDAYLRDSEAHIPDLKAGMEKGILWNDPTTHARTPLAIVYLHGFSASRHEASPLFEKVGADLRANVFFTRLHAHGLKDGEGFGTVSAQDWIDDAREALAIGHRIGERVVLVGLSTGAMLALDLALENVGDSGLAGLIMISPNFRPTDWRSTYISGPLGPWLARTIIGPYREFQIDSQLQGRYWTNRYRIEAIAQMMDLCNFIAKQDLGKIQLPVLTLYTKHDTVVSVDLIEEGFARLGSKRKKLIDLPEATRHEFVGEALAPQVVAPAEREIDEFLRSL